jgi:hypothetical protein
VTGGFERDSRVTAYLKRGMSPLKDVSCVPAIEGGREKLVRCDALRFVKSEARSDLRISRHSLEISIGGLCRSGWSSSRGAGRAADPPGCARARTLGPTRDTAKQAR